MGASITSSLNHSTSDFQYKDDPNQNGISKLGMEEVVIIWFYFQGGVIEVTDWIYYQEIKSSKV